MQELPLPEDHDRELFEGSDMTRLQSYLSIHVLFDRYRPSREEKQAVLHLLAIHAPPVNRCFRTLHEFEHFLGEGTSTSTVHAFCANCHHLFEPGEDACPIDQKPRYGGVNGDVDTAFFLTFSAETELRTRYLDPAFFEEVQHPFKRDVPPAGVITDVLDGSAYPRDAVRGQLHALGSTDGLRVFKSAKHDLWLVMLVLLELPPSIRYRQENMLLVGAWFGGKKPAFDVFFERVAAELNALQTPRTMKTPDGDLDVSLKLLTMTADNAAKEPMLGIKSTHCGACEQEPEFVANKRGVMSVPSFPLRAIAAPARSHESFLMDAATAHERRDPEVNADVDSDLESDDEDAFGDIEGEADDSHGVKVVAPLLNFHELDILLPQEYQHGVLLRVVGKLLLLLFSVQYVGQAFSHRAQLATLDRLLTDTRPPAFVSRPPRSYGEHGRYWKAVEYRAFLLYYGPLLLRDLIDRKYYNHYLLLSNAVGLLLRRAISPADLVEAHGLLRHFVQRFAILYGQQYMSRTVHHLLHLTESVQRWGPLWATSTFPFESVYRHFREMIHGTGMVLQQVRPASHPPPHLAPFSN